MICKIYIYRKTRINFKKKYNFIDFLKSPIFNDEKKTNFKESILNTSHVYCKLS